MIPADRLAAMRRRVAVDGCLFRPDALELLDGYGAVRVLAEAELARRTPTRADPDPAAWDESAGLRWAR